MSPPLHISDDRLVDLIHHLLPPEEEKAAMAHLEQCTDCEERFRVLLREHETARASRPSSGASTRVQRLPRGTRVALLAATAVAIVAIGLFATKRGRPELYWIPLQFDESALRSADSVATGSSDAFRAYEAHDANRAIELIEQSPSTDDEMVSSLRRLVLASALVNDSRPTEAIDELAKLEIFSLPVRWREQAQWVEYLALRDAGRAEEARSRLEKLAEYEGDIGDRARAERK